MTSHDGTVDWDAAAGRPERAADPAAGSAQELVQILDRYLAALQAGQAPDRERLLADHPELAGQLESCLAGIDFIHRTTASQGGEEGQAQLGEFRIVREIGRGGMGVVYEAEQTTLRRRVALKVLRFGVVADEGAMQRFRREAETVARLHHTNIVPIFAVGSERGVYYYAMQFIEGRNLAEVLAEAQAQGDPPRPEDVARWGLQAAEALEYAHRRGVIHRDVKPSNLLLDPEGIVWLTDFGLAKRADEATLTVAGTLMGTPRYMSPEQAESVSRPVDHRTDVYSLGAALYELATGRPVFEAATPHGVIRRILDDEPVPPRQARPGLPRDLETVILTCLAKDPARRYASAQALADDLRAVLDGRPIQARRVGPVGQAVRWAKRHRRTAHVAGAAAVAAVLLVGVAAVGWTLHSRAQLAHLALATAEPHLAAEILDARGAEVVPAVSLPTRQPLALPAGELRVRLAAPGQPTETYDLRLRRGESRSFDVGLGRSQLWEPIATDPNQTVHLLDRDGRTDLVQLFPQKIQYKDGATGRTLWEFTPPATGPADERDRLATAFGHIRGSGPISPGLVRPAPDLDGDGAPDLVWAGRNAPMLWAVSGAGDGQGRGRELWLFRSGHHGGYGGAVVGLPAPADVDGDGTPDLIATFQVNASTWVEAVSGRSGQSLWAFDVPALYGAPTPSGGSPRPLPAQVERIGDAERVVVTLGTGLMLLDPATGKPAWETQLGDAAVRAPVVADLDGDGSRDLLLVLQGPVWQRLVALAPARRQTLWMAMLLVSWRPDDAYASDLAPEWPLAADLDGDGAAEVVVPVSAGVGTIPWTGIEVLSGRNAQTLWQRRLRTPVFVTQVDRFIAGPDLDGDGHREVFAASIASERGRSYRNEGALVVDALSGRDGRGLWWWRRETTEQNDRVGPLRWGAIGPDGWPQLLVTHVAWPDRPGTVCGLSAGTGALVQELPGAFDPHPVDLDDDGALDLAYRTTESGSVRFGTGQFHALRGRPPAPWARLGTLDPAADLDGDGLEDLLESRDDGLTAWSGRDGRVLWDAGLASGAVVLRGRWSPLPADPDGRPAADLDGDGTPDLLLGMTSGVGYSNIDLKSVPIPLQAISGRTGRSLWTTPTVPNPTGRSAVFARPTAARCADLDGDGTPEVAAMVHLRAFITPGLDQLWLVVYSGRDGRLRWRRLLAEQTTKGSSHTLESFAPVPRMAQLDGEADLDVVLAVPVPAEGGLFRVELRAFGGRDGRLLWRHELPPRAAPVSQPEAVLPELALGDLDGNAAPDLVAVDPAPRIEGGKVVISDNRRAFRLVRLDGRTGRPLGEPWSFHDEQPMPQGPPRPVLADVDGQGRQVVALAVREEHGARIALLDASDEGLRPRDLPASDPLPVLSPSLYALDLDADGIDELVGVLERDGCRVVAFRGDPTRPLWSRSFEGMARIVEIRPGGPGRPACVVVGTLRNTVFGLDGATGQTLWRGHGRAEDPGPTIDGVPLFNSPLLHDARPGRTPRVVSRAYASTLCLLTRPVAATGGEAGPPFDRTPAVVQPDPADPRLLRPLPWTVLSRESMALALNSAAMALVLLVLPGLALAGVARSRPLRLGRLFLVPVILGLTLALARAWKPDLPAYSLLIQSVGGLPIVVLVWRLGLWLVLGRWRRLLLMAILVGAVAAVLAGVQLRYDARQMAPWQRYSREDWYWVLVPAAYGAGLLLMLGGLLAALGRLARRGWRRVRRGPQPA